MCSLCLVACCLCTMGRRIIGASCMDAALDVTMNGAATADRSRVSTSAPLHRGGGSAAQRLNPLRAKNGLIPVGRPHTAQSSPHPFDGAAPPLSFEGPVGVVRCVSPVELSSIVDRLYRKGLEDKRRHQELSAASERSPSPSASASRPLSPPVAARSRPVSAAPVLTTDEMKESVDRLYYSGIKHKLDAHKRLADKYLFQHPRKQQPGVSAQELRDKVVQRFYVEEKSRHQKVQDDLHKAYVEATAPNVSRRSREEIVGIVDRLYKGSN